MSAKTPEEYALERLDDQIAWYDAKGVFNKDWFKRLKIAGMIAAASVPVVSLAVPPSVALSSSPGGPALAPLISAVLGSLVVLLEGVQQLNQFQANWISYRSTCETLKHEKYLFLSRAAHYTGVPSPERLLVERIESLVSQEHAKWATSSAREPREKAEESEPKA